MQNIANASLKEEINFVKEGVAIVIPADTAVKVDVANDIGYWNGDHFALFKGEYSVEN